MTHKFLSKFQTLADYNNFLVSAQCPYTNVSYVEQTDLNYYFKDNTYTSQPFTITIDSLPDGVDWCALRSDTFNDGSNGKFLKFKVNDGPWTDLRFGNDWIDYEQPQPIHFVEGDSIQFISNIMKINIDTPSFCFCSYGEYDSYDGYEFTVEGNILSLYSEDYMGISTVPTLREDRSIVSIVINNNRAKTLDLSGLFIPARPTEKYTYKGVFYGDKVNLEYNGGFILPTIYSYGYTNDENNYPSLEETCNQNRTITTANIYIDGNVPTLTNMFMADPENVDTVLTQVNITYGNNIYAPRDVQAFSMFYNRTALATVPNLNPIFAAFTASHKWIDCASMFQNCSSLTDASSLELRGYIGTRQMFMDCSSLEKSPKIYQRDIHENMFNGCSSLNTIYYLYNNSEDEGNVEGGAFDNIPETGTFYVSSTPPYNIDSLVPSGWSKVTYTE